MALDHLYLQFFTQQFPSLGLRGGRRDGQGTYLLWNQIIGMGDGLGKTSSSSPAGLTGYDGSGMDREACEGGRDDASIGSRKRDGQLESLTHAHRILAHAHIELGILS